MPSLVVKVVADFYIHRTRMIIEIFDKMHTCIIISTILYIAINLIFYIILDKSSKRPLHFINFLLN